MEIICDDRERYVTKFMDGLQKKFNIDYKIDRLTVGDYAICYKKQIILVIERKTWCDLASSIRDGRKNNVNKLFDIRDTTGCNLSYLIEGDAFPKPTKLFSRFPAKNLRAHLDHLMFRDNIHVIHTKDCEGTAYRLFELAKNFISNKLFLKSIDDKLIVGADESDVADNSPDDSPDNPDDHRDRLKKKYVSQINKQEQMLRKLPHVGSIISNLLNENDVTIKGISNKKHSVDFISSLKYPSGARIGFKKATKIFNNHKMISKSTITNKKLQVKILETIPLISKNTSKIILEKYTLIDIINNNITVIELSELILNKKKLGNKAATNIISYLQNT